MFAEVGYVQHRTWIELNKRTRTDLPMPYTVTVSETYGTETFETIIHKLRLLFAGSTICMGDDQLTKHVMLGTLKRDEIRYERGQELDWMQFVGHGPNLFDTEDKEEER